MKTRTRWLAALAAAAAASALGCGKRDRTTAAPAEPLEAIAPLPAPLSDPLDDKPGFIATLTPEQLVDVTAPYTSASATIVVKLGDVITQGQVLAKLDDRQLRQELAAARAQASTAQASVRQALVDKRGAEDVLTRERTAEAAGVGSRADVAAASQAVDKATAAIAVARANADERATRIAQLQAHLTEMTLIAPIAGSVAMIYPQQGARVEEGRPVIRVISGGVFVKFAIPADKVATVKVGDLVDLRLDRRPDTIAAKIDQVSPELDAVAQMIIARAALVTPPPDLQPGTVGRILPRATPTGVN